MAEEEQEIQELKVRKIAENPISFLHDSRIYGERLTDLINEALRARGLEPISFRKLRERDAQSPFATGSLHQALYQEAGE